MEELAREKNADFWSFYDEPTGDVAEDVHGGDEGANNSGAEDGDEGANNSGAGDGNETTTSGAGDGNETTDGGERTDGSQAKKARKERSKNKVRALRQAITEVSPGGAPLEPTGVAAGYGLQVACILRDVVPVYEDNIRDANKEGLRLRLIKRLHERYEFPPAYRADEDGNHDMKKLNAVNNFALTKMSKALSSWRSRVKKLIEDDKSPEEIWNKERVNEEDLRIFRGRLGLPVSKKMSEWGRWMNSKNVGHHHLGSGGYFAAEPKWEKQDAEWAEKGIANPFAKFKDKQTRNFVRARFTEDPVTKELTTDPAVVKFQKALEEVESSRATDESSSQGSTKPVWDTPFNAALNKVKGRDLDKPPSGGRVVGHGKVLWCDYYAEDKETRKERKKRKQEDIVNELVAKALVGFLPSVVTSVTDWIDGGRQGPCPVPNFGGNTANTASAASSANTAPPPPPVRDNPPVLTTPSPLPENSPAGTAPSGAHSDSLSQAVGGVSTMAELDALMVSKRRRLNAYYFIHFSFALHL